MAVCVPISNGVDIFIGFPVPSVLVMFVETRFMIYSRQSKVYFLEVIDDLDIVLCYICSLSKTNKNECKKLIKKFFKILKKI